MILAEAHGLAIVSCGAMRGQVHNAPDLLEFGPPGQLEGVYPAAQDFPLLNHERGLMN